MTELTGTDPGIPIPARRISPEEGRGSGDHFAVPLGSAKRGLLRFTNRTHRLLIRADSRLRGLCHARFGEPMPTVGVKGGLVTIRYPRVKVGDWPDCRLRSSAEITLNPSIPWDIEIRGGASRFVADLRGLRLGSFSVHGGAGRLEVTLPAPSGTVPVILFGGVSNVAVHRPEGVSARLRVAGGVTHLRFDERHIGAAGGELDLRSRNYEGSTGRYDVTVTGGANNMSIDCERNVSLDR